MPSKKTIGAAVNEQQLKAIDRVRNGRTDAQLVHTGLAQIVPGYQLSQHGGDRKSENWQEKHQLVSADVEFKTVEIKVNCFDKEERPELPYAKNWYWTVEAHDQDGYDEFNNGNDLTDWYPEPQLAYRAALTWLLQNEF